MANIQNIPLNESLRLSNPKVNQNFQNLNNEILANKADADNKIEAHKSSTIAHPAQHIPYSGAVIGAENTKQALDKLKQTIDDLVLGSDDSDPNTRAEVEAARGGKPTLGDRLDASDVHLENVAKDMDQPLVGRQKTVKTDDAYNCWPVLVKTNTNRYVVFYASGLSHLSTGNEDVAGRKLCYKYSDNYGVTWSDETVLFYDPNMDFATFGASSLSNGDIICFVVKKVLVDGVTTEIDNLVIKSSDNGSNFAEVFAFSDSTDEIIRSVSYANVPVEMDNGKIIASKQVRVGGYIGLAFIFSSDNGNSWNESVTVIPPDTYTSYDQLPWEVRIAYLGGGRLLAIGRNNVGNVYQLNSSDYGQTWTRYTTNINDCRKNCLYPLFFKAENQIVLYYNDRSSNTVKKRTVDATFAFKNPTLWPEAKVITYTSSSANSADSGYITAARNNDSKPETTLCLYTTRDISTDLSTPKDTAVVVIYDSVEDQAKTIAKNQFINGGFGVWPYGTTFNATNNTPVYTAGQWIFDGTGTNTVSRSQSSADNKRLLAINAVNSDTYVRLFQPIVGLSRTNVYTLSLKANFGSNATVKLYLRYTSSGGVVENTDVAAQFSVTSGIKTLSFTFNKPSTDLDTVMFIGVEITGKATHYVYNMKLEEGYSFTGFNEENSYEEEKKCSMYYEEFNGTMSYPSRPDGNLMSTLTFERKAKVPTVTMYWNSSINTARAWTTADAGTVSLTINPGLNFARFYATKPSSTTPNYYDVNKIVVDARIYP